VVGVGCVDGIGVEVGRVVEVWVGVGFGVVVALGVGVGVAVGILQLKILSDVIVRCWFMLTRFVLSIVWLLLVFGGFSIVRTLAVNIKTIANSATRM
jgi:hypothetical protein